MGSSVKIDPQYDGIVMLSPEIIFFNDAQPRPDGRKIFHVFEQNEGLSLPDEISEAIDYEDFELNKSELFSKASENSLQYIQKILAENGIQIENWPTMPNGNPSLVSVKSPQTLLANMSLLNLGPSDSTSFHNGNDGFESSFSDCADENFIEDQSFSICTKSDSGKKDNPLDRRKPHRFKTQHKVSAKKAKKKKKKPSYSEEGIISELPPFLYRKEAYEAKHTVLPASFKSLSASTLGFTRCKICKELTKLNSYEAHLQLHLGTKSMEVLKEENVSGYDENVDIDLMDNLKRETLDNADKYKCSFCSFVTTIKLKLVEHEESHSIDHKPLLCLICNFSSFDFMEIKSHMKIFHSIGDDIIDSVDALSLRDNLVYNPREEKPYICNLCDHRTLKLNSFKTHTIKSHSKNRKMYFVNRSNYSSNLAKLTLSHENDKVYKCKLCDYKCIHKAEYKFHLKIHKGTVLKCSHCFFSTNSKDSLEQHEQLHVEEVKCFSCTECSYQSAHQNDMQNHMAKHSDDKEFKCPDCNYTCSNKRFMVRHIRTHTGEKPFFCFACDYRCIQYQCLERHLEKHNKTLMNCAFCHFSTLNSSALVLHLKSQHSLDIWEQPPLKCERCSFKCYFNKNLENHMQFHIDSECYIKNMDVKKSAKAKIYYCKICDYSTDVKKDLKYHRKKVHS